VGGYGAAVAAAGAAEGVLIVGMVTEGQIRDQLKKGQGETNKRLEALLAEQQRTNALLAQLVQLLGAQQQVQPQQTLRGPVSWGTQG
jgi:hypothetical protein